MASGMRAGVQLQPLCGSGIILGRLSRILEDAEVTNQKIRFSLNKKRRDVSYNVCREESRRNIYPENGTQTHVVPEVKTFEEEH